MKAPKKLETSFRRIEEISYENVNGGAYAYLQFLAYTRDVLKLLRPVQKAERQREAIEAMNWLFNEYLAVRFTHTHQLIFEDKKREIKQVFDTIRLIFNEKQEPLKTRKPFDGKLFHAQAA